ncbi:MAG: damage-control phosphatase ARMT1 family protein [Acetivibrionales bacterium]|jgi:uncharacterized protein with ATP-grasp and redox domains
MEIFLDCLPCNLRQVLEASRMVTDRMDVQVKIMKEAAKLISDYEKFRCSLEIGRAMHQIVKKHTGILDPYKKIKDRSIESALQLYPSLKQFLQKKENRLYWALKIAATGNTIDSAVYRDISIEECIVEELNKEFSICNIEKLESELKCAKKLLVIGDNAGETVFDRIMIEELLHLDITYAVRSEPIINDVIIDDACASGLDQCSRLISTGCNAPGVILDECNEEFLNIFNNADIVISKGQGNYESLSEQKRGIFFLLKAKCPVISKMFGVRVNDYVFKRNG